MKKFVLCAILAVFTIIFGSLVYGGGICQYASSASATSENIGSFASYATGEPDAPKVGQCGGYEEWSGYGYTWSPKSWFVKAILTLNYDALVYATELTIFGDYDICWDRMWLKNSETNEQIEIFNGLDKKCISKKLLNGDFLADTLVLETCGWAWSSTDSVELCGNTDPAPTCGNSIVEQGEECDDGNLIDGDGCSSDCSKEDLCCDVDCSYLDDECNYGGCDSSCGECIKVAKNDGIRCYDGNKCTENDVCIGGECGGSEIDCDDGKWCNGQETCDSELGCVQGSAPCVDVGECIDVSCDEDNDRCVYNKIPDCCTTDEDCDDSNACTEDVCVDGGCENNAIHCDDGVSCTLDICDQQKGCVNIPDDSLCDNGLFCDGVEYCDAELDCQLGMTIDCDDKDRCTEDSCDEEQDSCVNEAIVGCCTLDSDCDYLDNDFCEGDKIFHDEGTCKNNECLVIRTAVKDCSSLDTTYCYDTQIRHDDYICRDAVCVGGETTIIDECDDGLACTGREYCLNAECVEGTPVDCSGNNLGGVATCFYNPDKIDYTWDYRAQFNSHCLEPTGICTMEDTTITHTCDFSCGAECEDDDDCYDTECDHKDGCYGYDYYDYHDVPNDCMGSCDCEQNACEVVTVYENDPKCTPCQKDTDCDYLGSDRCYEDVILRDEGVCIDFECWQVTTVVRDCNDFNADYCEGSQIRHDDYTCEAASCVLDITSAKECDDGKACNGQEMCRNLVCEVGIPIDCSYNNIFAIGTCDFNPDGNPYTWDSRDQFISECRDVDGDGYYCTTDNYDISHECSTVPCGAECIGGGGCGDYCANDEIIKRSGTCTDCKCVYQSENCSSQNGWYVVKERWIDHEKCVERKQNKTEYRDYGCGVVDLTAECIYVVTQKKWVNTSEFRNKTDCCKHDVGIRYSYGNSFETGIAIRPVGGDWMGDSVGLIRAEKYEVKYYIDNKIEDTTNNIHVVVSIDGVTVADYSTSISSYHSKTVSLNVSGMDVGEYNLSLFVEKIDEEDCNMTDNFASRLVEIVPYCGDGIEDEGEECDDGNNEPCDGCSSDCKSEEGGEICDGLDNDCDGLIDEGEERRELIIESTTEDDEQVYLDGKWLSSSWVWEEKTINPVVLETGEHVLALGLENWGFYPGFIVSVFHHYDEVLFNTQEDGTWVYSTDCSGDWTKPNFDDSSWQPLESVGFFGSPHWGYRPDDWRDYTAKWLWADNYTKLCVRKRFEIFTYLEEECGEGHCGGYRLCVDGEYDDCSSQYEDCGVCCECDEDGMETYDSHQNNDCMPTICPESGCGYDECDQYSLFPEEVENECIYLFECSEYECEAECLDEDLSLGKLSFRTKGGDIVYIGDDMEFVGDVISFSGWLKKIFHEYYADGVSSLEVMSETNGKRVVLNIRMDLNWAIVGCDEIYGEMTGTGTYYKKGEGSKRLDCEAEYWIDRISNKVDVQGSCDGIEFRVEDMNLEIV